MLVLRCGIIHIQIRLSATLNGVGLNLEHLVLEAHIWGGHIFYMVHLSGLPFLGDWESGLPFLGEGESGP